MTQALAVVVSPELFLSAVQWKGWMGLYIDRERERERHRERERDLMMTSVR
jgi:hypothetical protein